MKFQIEQISSYYTVKKFSEQDIPDILTLCKGNPTYYKHMKIQPDFENIREVLTMLPPNKTIENKFFAGFYRNNRLTAILDLITEYPKGDTAYIGWFMMNKEFQKMGIGSKIINEILSFLKERNFHSVQLGYIKGNQESEKFWIKNKFLPTGEETEMDNVIVVNMQREL